MGDLLRIGGPATVAPPPVPRLALGWTPAGTCAVRRGRPPHVALLVPGGPGGPPTCSGSAGAHGPTCDARLGVLPAVGQPSGAAGNRTTKQEPRPGALSTSTVPPCAATIAATIDRPSPLPVVDAVAVRVRAVSAR